MAVEGGEVVPTEAENVALDEVTMRAWRTSRGIFTGLEQSLISLGLWIRCFTLAYAVDCAE